MYYDKFKMNMYSQNGEDGVLLRLFNELDIAFSSSWCVDVGAYDGISYSNVRQFINQGSNAVMIEPANVGGACEPKFKQLKHLPDTFPNVTVINAGVISPSMEEDEINGIKNFIKSWQTDCGDDNPEDVPFYRLDDILIKTDIAEDYDVLNIDTDRCDHEIWQDHEKYKPKIVIIEIESSIPPDSTEQGGGLASFSHSLKIAKEKGYSLVCHTGNMIYVRNDLVDRLSIPRELINSVELFNRSWL